MYIVEDGFKRHNFHYIGNEINNIVFTYRPHSIKYIQERLQTKD
jgi:hypothetical protein